MCYNLKVILFLQKQSNRIQHFNFLKQKKMTNIPIENNEQRTEIISSQKENKIALKYIK